MANWKPYYEVTKDRPPRALVVEAAGFVVNKNKALDLGAGHLVDAKYLLEEGFEVTAVDADPAMLEFGKEIADKNPKLKLVNSTFEKFNFEPSTYDYIISLNALPFVNDYPIGDLLKNIIASLTPNGVFAATFFGENDSWNVTGSKISFVTHEELMKVFENEKVLKIAEEEVDKPSKMGPMKHWHFLRIIVQKIS